MKFYPHLLSLIICFVTQSFSATITSSDGVDGFPIPYLGSFGKGFQIDREILLPGYSDSMRINTLFWGYRFSDANISIPYLDSYKNYQHSSSRNFYIGINKILKNNYIGFLLKDISFYTQKDYESTFYTTDYKSAFSIDLSIWSKLSKGPFQGIAFNVKRFDCEDSEYADYKYKEETKEYGDSLIQHQPYSLRKDKDYRNSEGITFELNLLSHKTKNGGHFFAGGFIETDDSEYFKVKNVTCNWEETYIVSTISNNGDTITSIEEVNYLLVTPNEIGRGVRCQQGEFNLGFVFPSVNNVVMAINGGVRYAHKRFVESSYFAEVTGNSFVGYKVTGVMVNEESKFYSDTMSVFLESYFNRRIPINSFNVDIGLVGFLSVKGFSEEKNNIKDYFNKPLYYYKNRSKKEIKLTAPIYLSYFGKKLKTYIGWYPQYYSSIKVGTEEGFEKISERDLKFNSLELDLAYSINEKISLHLTPSITEDIKFLNARIEVTW